MLKVLECKRDESMKPFDAETAQQLATELYNAGGGKTIGTQCMYMQCAFMCTCCCNHHHHHDHHHITTSLSPNLSECISTDYRQFP